MERSQKDNVKMRIVRKVTFLTTVLFIYIKTTYVKLRCVQFRGIFRHFKIYMKSRYI